MEQSLAVRDSMNLANWQVMTQQAEMLVKSGFLPASIKTKEQAVAIILTGQELGLPPMLALRKINVIQGVPTVAPELMLALCYSRVKGFQLRWYPRLTRVAPSGRHDQALQLSSIQARLTKLMPRPRT